MWWGVCTSHKQKKRMCVCEVSDLTTMHALSVDACLSYREQAIKTWVKAASQLLTCRGSYMARRAKVTSSYMVYSKAMAR